MRLTEEVSVRLIPTVLLSALLALSPPAVAESGTAQEVVSAVESTYKDVESLKADFVQTTRSTLGETSQKGEVHLKRPRQMRWDFTEPAASSFITNGEKLWVWSATDNQVIVTNDLSGSSSGNDMSQLLTDLSRLGELFNVEEQGGPDAAVHVLKLTPKTDAQFKSLTITVAKEGYTLQRVVMVDQFDSTVELDFSGVTLNPTIADEQFNFVVPEGATVLNTDGI